MHKSFSHRSAFDRTASPRRILVEPSKAVRALPHTTGGPQPLTNTQFLRACGVILCGAGVITAGWAYAARFVADWYIGQDSSQQSMRRLAGTEHPTQSETTVGERPTEQ